MVYSLVLKFPIVKKCAKILPRFVTIHNISSKKCNNFYIFTVSINVFVLHIFLYKCNFLIICLPRQI